MQSTSLAAMGQMASGVVHDIRTPMTVIKGYSDLMHRELKDLLGDRYAETDTRRNLDSIDKAVNHCNSIVEDLLHFSNPEHSGRNLGSLNQLVEESLEFMRTEIAMRQIEPVIRLDPDLPLTCHDPSQFKRVLINLMMNALQAMDEGGRLSLRTARLDRPETSYAAVFVSDTGCGMNEAQRERIFEPFFSTRKSGHPDQGTGLGLTVCYHIVENHGGEVSVESTPGVGTTFTILLPEAAG